MWTDTVEKEAKQGYRRHSILSRLGSGEIRGVGDIKNKLPIKRRQEIGERVRAIRKSRRLEQTELAKEMGLSQAIISQYEKGYTEIPLSFLEYFKRKHGVSSDWMIFGTGEMKAAIARNLDGTQDKFLKLIKQTQKSLGDIGNQLKMIEKNVKGKK